MSLQCRLLCYYFIRFLIKNAVQNYMFKITVEQQYNNNNKNHNKMVRQFKKQTAEYILDVSLNTDTIQIQLFSLFPHPPKYFRSEYRADDLGACLILCDSLEKLYMFLYKEERNYVVEHREGIIKLLFQIATNKQTVTRSISIKLDECEMKIRPVDKNKKSQPYSQSQSQPQYRPEQFDHEYQQNYEKDVQNKHENKLYNSNKISIQKPNNQLKNISHHSSNSSGRKQNVDDFIRQVNSQMQQLHSIIQQKFNYKYENQSGVQLQKRMIQMVDEKDQREINRVKNQEKDKSTKKSADKNPKNIGIQQNLKKQNKNQTPQPYYKFSKQHHHDQIMITNDFAYSNYYSIITDATNTVILIDPKIMKKKKNPTIGIKMTTSSGGYAIGVCEIEKVKALNYTFNPRSDAFNLLSSNGQIYSFGGGQAAKMDIGIFQEIRMTMFYNEQTWILRFWDAIMGESEVIQIFQDEADLAFCMVNFGTQFAGTICTNLEDP